MAVMSNQEIRQNLGQDVVVWPFKDQNVNTSSYDVTLGDSYYVERRPSFVRRFCDPIYNIWDFNDVQRAWAGPYQSMPLDWWKWKYPWRFRGSYRGFKGYDKVIFVPPKHSILAHTYEFIGGRNNTTTEMRARSTYGRNHIQVCACSGWGDVGYINRWTMEVYNRSRFYWIPLVVGRRIAQIIFHKTGEVDGDYSTTGKYQDTDNIEVLKHRWNPEMMLPRLDLDRDNPDLCKHGFLDWDQCPNCRH